MRLHSNSFGDRQVIPSRHAFVEVATVGHGVTPTGPKAVRRAPNEHPHVAWSEAPEAARSMALLMVDLDTPRWDVGSVGVDDVIPVAFPRAERVHWVLVDLPVDGSEIAAGSLGSASQDSASIFGRGARLGINDRSRGRGVFDPSIELPDGYLGPAPPLNDELVHRYIFTIYALDIERLEVDERFTGADVLRALDGHVLAQASWEGFYALNPNAVYREF